jgi:HK97 family phage portal protein
MTNEKPRVRVRAVTSPSTALVTKAVEGEYRPGPYWLPVTGGWLSADVGQFTNWWQMGYDPQGTNNSALVEACVAAYSQTVAMCPGDHWRATDNGGRERVSNSALTRFLKVPNDYETISDYFLNSVRYLYSNGNSYSLILRNDRFEPDSVHLMDPDMSRPMVAANGEIFYYLGGNEVIAKTVAQLPILVPARDVIHIKLQSLKHNKLMGVSPIVAAASDIAVSGAMTAQQMTFYMNMARPSTVLSTDRVLDQAQLDLLRDRWNQESRGLNTGGTVILSQGLKPLQLSTAPKDAELADILKLTQQNIAMAFSIPLQILGIGTETKGSTEELMNFWLARSLGFLLNHIEEAIGKKFKLKGVPDEYLELNTIALLRSNRRDRIATLSSGVLGGIYSPNEARKEEELPAVEAGDEPRVQQQVVPLSAANQIQPAPGPHSAPPAPAPQLPQPKKLLELTDEATISARRRFRSSYARNIGA